MADAGETPRSFAWDDPFDIDCQLREDEKPARDKARAFVQGHLVSRVRKDYLVERLDREIMTRMGGVGLLGPAIPQASARRGSPASRAHIAAPCLPFASFHKFQTAGGTR